MSNKKTTISEVVSNYQGNALNNLKSDILSCCIFYRTLEELRDAVNFCLDEVCEILGGASE